MSPMLPAKTTPCQQLLSPLFTEQGIRVFIKREDLNHPTIQGNKYHKLKLNLEQARLKNSL